MAVAHQLISAHNGHIHVDSRVNEGTALHISFRFYFHWLQSFLDPHVNLSGKERRVVMELKIHQVSKKYGKK